MSTLRAAFALPDVADRTRAVAYDLHLDVACAGYQALDIYIVGAEGSTGLGLASAIRFVEFGPAVDSPHPTATASGNGLDHHRPVAQRLVKVPRLV